MQLRADGYIISAVTNKGYAMIESPDIMDSHELCSELELFSGSRKWENIYYLPSTGSTNDYAKSLAAKGCQVAPDRTVIIADCQTSGRGRMGRAWFSEAGKGIWMSVIFRPALPPSEYNILTLAAAVAVNRAVKKTTGLVCGIKWPNDLLINGSKVCGILSEMAIDSDTIDYAVCGIGINILHDRKDFPEEILGNATSIKIELESLGEAGGSLPVTQSIIKRSRIASTVLIELDRVYEMISEGRTSLMLDEWRSHNVTCGRMITVNVRGNEFDCFAEDVTSEGRLLVCLPDGSKRELSSGEISIKKNV